MESKQVSEQKWLHLTSYPIGSFKEFIAIFIPLFLLLLSGSIMNLCDRLFLSRYSIEALEACTSTLSLCALFHIPAVRIVSIIQAFIGKHKGEGDLQKIGEYVWQMMWLSIFIFLLSLPLGTFAEHFFFKNTSIARLGIPYFRTLLLLNFLLPFGAALSSFYVGQGKTQMILYATLCSHAVHVVIDPILIFGIKGVFSPLGLQGASIAMLIGQSVYCGILLKSFLQAENRHKYGTGDFTFKRSLFWKCLRIGVPRSLSRGIALLTWTAVVRLLTLKGGAYLLVISFGASIHLLFLFVIDGMGQAIVTIGSYVTGLKKMELIRNLIRNAGLLIAIMMVLLAIPYLFFPDHTVSFLLPKLKDPELQRYLRYSCYWSYVFFLAQSVNSIAHNLLTAFQDTLFQMVYNALFSWILTYGVTFYVIEIWHSPAHSTWLVMSLASAAAALVYFIRAKIISNRIKLLASIA
ncbi:MAG: hypothetical protein HYZ47_01670 [Simkania negevensis]|nr:hypothetical protein [Simkania negevensis]